MSSTPTKAEKEQGIKVYEFKWTNEPEKPRLQLIDIEDHLEAVDSLKERLRLAEEFIRARQYRHSFGGANCIGCNARECHPCTPDCELQKILGQKNNL